MKKLSIEVISGIIDYTAYVFDENGNKLCAANGYDSYKAIENVSLKLSSEINDIKNNKDQIDFFKTIEKGTKVRYKAYGNMNNFGYYAGVVEDKGLITVSKIPHDDEFSGLRMTDFGMYKDVDAKLVELYEED